MSTPDRNVGTRIAVFEPDPRGHRLYYVRILVSSLAATGASVEIVTSEAAPQSPEWSIHLSDLPEIPVRTLDPSSSLAALGIDSDLHGVQQTIVPDGDRYLVDAVRGRWRAYGTVSLLAMRPDSQAGTGVRPMVWGLAKKLLILFAAKRRRVRAAALKSPLVRKRFPIRWISDPVTLLCSEDDVRIARADLDSSGEHFWVGVFGSITPRKNLHLIADAVLEVPGAALLIAGSLDDASRDLSSDALERLTRAGREVRFRTDLKDADFDALIASVDCVVAAHSNEGPSGIVGKAHAAGRPLVLAGAKTLREDAQAVGEWAAWSELESSAIARNIRVFAARPSPAASLSSDTQDFVDGLT